MFIENKGWFQQWGEAIGIRTTSDIAYSITEWFPGGGPYHSYYMWHGGTNYGRTASSSITTLYTDDVCLHADGTPHEPKYTQLSRLQHLIAEHAKDLLSQDSTRTLIPCWNETQWRKGSEQFVYSYPSSTHFVINQYYSSINVLFRNKNISMVEKSVQIYDHNMILLWDSANYSDIVSDNTEILSVVVGPLKWQTWSESVPKNFPVVTSLTPMEQLNITNDETIYLWYRRNVTLKQALANRIIIVQTHIVNALLFFLNGQFLGEFDNHDHSEGNIEAFIAVDLSPFQANQQYLFEILSISLGINNAVRPDAFERKGSIKVDWNTEWTKGIDKPVTWFQVRFDLDHLVREDTNANPVLLDAQGLNRGHAFIHGNDLGLYWLVQGICQSKPCCCQQVQINCLQPTQRYYHIPSDWLKPTNNLITIFDDLGVHSPGLVGLVQRIIIN